jgi:hypothetical protein
MPRKAATLTLCLTDETRARLSTFARSRTAPAHHVERSAIILHLADQRDVTEIAAKLHIDSQRVARCLRWVMAVGPLEAFDDLPRSGRRLDITEAARTWLIGEACVKAKERGYPHKVWTLRLLAAHARELARAEFIAFLERLDAHYPAGMLICLLLDNHSAHRSHEARRFLASKPGRFELVFTPTHASWLNNVETLLLKGGPIRVAAHSRRQQGGVGRPHPPLYRKLQRRTGSPALAIWHHSGLPSSSRPVESAIRERSTR